MATQDSDLDTLRHQLMLSLLQGVRSGNVNKAFANARREREEYKERARGDLRSLFLAGIRNGELHAALRDVKQQGRTKEATSTSAPPPQYSCSLLADAKEDDEEATSTMLGADVQEEMRRNILDSLVQALRAGRLAEVLPTRVLPPTSIPMAAAEDCTEQEVDFEDVVSLDSDSDGEEVLEGMAQHYIGLAFQGAEAEIERGLNEMLQKEDLQVDVDGSTEVSGVVSAETRFDITSYFSEHFAAADLGFIHAMFQTVAADSAAVAEAAEPADSAATTAIATATPLAIASTPASPSKATRSRTIFGGVQRQAKPECSSNSSSQAGTEASKTLLLTDPVRGMHRAVVSCPNLLSPSAPALKRPDGALGQHQDQQQQQQLQQQLQQQRHQSQPLLTKASAGKEKEKGKIVAAAQLGPLLVKPGAMTRSRSASSAVSAVALDLGLNLLPSGLWPTALPGVAAVELSPMKLSKASQGLLPSLACSNQKPFSAWELSPHKSLRSLARPSATNF